MFWLEDESCEVGLGCMSVACINRGRIASSRSGLYAAVSCFVFSSKKERNVLEQFHCYLFRACLMFVVVPSVDACLGMIIVFHEKFPCEFVASWVRGKIPKSFGLCLYEILYLVFASLIEKFP